MRTHNKTNSKKGNARKGGRYETVTVLKNNGIARDANEKVTKTVTRYRYFKDKGLSTLAGFFYANYDIMGKGRIRLIKH